MEIGERLREARESKKLSLETLQDKTKIQKRYLEAIEQGNFQVLPGRFYTRAFIKEYATAVGLDPNELLEEHQSEIPQVEEESTTYTHISRSRRKSDTAKTPAVFSFIPTVIVILLIVGILFAAYFFYQQTTSDEGVKPVERENGNEVIYPNDSDQSEGGQTDENTEGNDEQTNEEGSDDPAANENSDTPTDQPDKPQPELVVTETGSGATPESHPNTRERRGGCSACFGTYWRSMVKGTGWKWRYPVEGILNSETGSKTLDISNQNSVRLNVGHAPSLNITVGGVPVEYPVDPQNSDHQYLVFNINKASEQTN